jgi:hypothetical protein
MDLDERLRHRCSGAQDGSWGRRPGRPGTWELDMTGVMSRLRDVGPSAQFFCTPITPIPGNKLRRVSINTPMLAFVADS